MGPNFTVIVRMLLQQPPLPLLFYLILFNGICLFFTLSIKKDQSPFSNIQVYVMVPGKSLAIWLTLGPRGHPIRMKLSSFLFDITLSLCNSKPHKEIIPLPLVLSLDQSSDQYLFNICQAYTLSKNCFHGLSKQAAINLCL